MKKERKEDRKGERNVGSREQGKVKTEPGIIDNKS